MSSIDRNAYPFAANFIAIDGAKIHYVDQGHGPVILFAHGTPTWSFEWRHQIAALSTNFRCIAPDHLGFGLSERPANADYRPEAHAARFRQLVEALDLRAITLVVHDYGGPIALPIALDLPERIARVTVINSWMWDFRADPTMRSRARLIDSALGRWLYRYANFSLQVITPSAYGDRKKLTKAIHRHYLERFPDPDSREMVLFALAKALLASSDFYAGLWQRRALLARFPLQLIWGMRDSAFGPPILAQWQAAFPQAEVVELKQAGHWPHEEAPEAVTAALTRFVATPATQLQAH